MNVSVLQSRSQLSKYGGGGSQAGWVWQLHLNVKRIHIGHRERKEFGCCGLKCFNHDAFYVGYTVTIVLESAVNIATGACLQKKFLKLHSLQCRRMPICKHHLICIRKLKSIISDITITRYYMIKVQSYGRGRSLSWGHCPPFHPPPDFVACVLSQ